MSYRGIVEAVLNNAKKLSDRDVNAGRVSQRRPTAVKATESYLDPTLVIDSEVMKRDPALFQTNIEAIESSGSFRKGRGSAENRAKVINQQMVDNLLALHDSVPSDVRQQSKLWYDGANRLANQFAEKYGISPESAAGALASLSPQKDWYQNVSLAERVIDIVKTKTSSPYTKEMIEHGRKIFADPKYANDLSKVETAPYSELSNDQKAMWVRIYDEANNNRGYRIVSPDGHFMDYAMNKDGVTRSRTAWPSNSTIYKAISVIENPSIENISDKVGNEHKVRNFYNNIIAPDATFGDVTMDTHAVAAAHLKPYSGNSIPVIQNFGGAGSASSSIHGVSGTYGITADAYRDAARQAGILPREMQSITWEAARGLFKDTFKTEKNAYIVNKIWNDYRTGKITIGEARDIVNAVAKGIDAPTWYSEGFDIRKQPGSSKSSYQDGNVTPDMLKFLTAVGIISAAAAPEDAEAGVVNKGIKTIIEGWHGTPHTFDPTPDNPLGAFDLSKVGTGEGAQAFGHGAYIADSKDVATKYRDDLANRDIKNQNRLTPHANAKRLVSLAGDPEYAAEDIRFVLDSQPNHDQKQLLQETLQFIESGDYKLPLPESGSLYKVEFDATPEELLDWDKPLNEQPKKVLDALINAYGKEDIDLAASLGYTGRELYRNLDAGISEADLSKKLAGFGIKGIQYDDGMSRGGKGTTKNYVVFDDKTLNILERGNIDPRLLGAMGVGAASLAASQDSEASVIGKTAKTWSRDAEKLARQMQQAGATADEIWQETGRRFGAPTYFGPDGQLRQEISDKGAALKIDPSQEWSGPFGDMYSNENLFAAYPDLARVLTEYNPNAYHSSFERSTYQKPPMIRVGGGAKDAAEGATHEAQHYIQNVEMFGGGASPLEFMPKYEAARDAADAQIRRINPLLSEKARQMEDIRQQIAQTPVMMRDDLNAKLAAVRDEYQALIDEKDKYIQATLKPASDLAMDEYRKYAGEQEAYATEARMGLDVPQMIERPRTMDMDVPMSEQKIRQQMPMPRTYRQLVGGAAAAGAASQSQAAQPDPVTQEPMARQKPAMPDGINAYIKKANERRASRMPEGVPTPTLQTAEAPRDYTGKVLAAGAEGLTELDRRLQGSPFSILSPTGLRDYMLKRAYNDEVGTLDKVGALFDIAALGRGKAIMQGRARPTAGELVAMPGLSALLGGEYTPESPDEQVLRELGQ